LATGRQRLGPSHLTDQDLKDIGVLLGHRRKILAAVAELPKKSPSASKTFPPLVEARDRHTTEPPQPAPAAPPPTDAMGERRHVAVMFCDLVDSKGIAAKLDPEEWRDLVGAYIDAASAAVVEMGGKVAKKLGDPNQPWVAVVARTAPWRQTMIKAKTVLAFVIALSAVAARAADDRSILTYHSAPNRSGDFIVPALTVQRARGTHLDSGFQARLSGALYAQPLYWRAAGSRISLPGGSAHRRAHSAQGHRR
jgi:hypothetical protein